jgi:preprotein translocase subunit SecE
MDKGPGIDPKRMVAIAFMVAAPLLGIFLEKVLALAFSYTRWNDFPVFGEDWTITTVAGFAVAAAAALVAWRTPRVQTLALEVAGELKKVTWPSIRETRAATLAVIAATFAAAAILGLFDYVWAWLSARIY